MSRVLAIARLTFFEGVRMRIVLVFLAVLAVLLVQLPFAMRGDETLSGRLQSFLDYSLSALSVLMSLSTVFLACYSLSNEVRTRSLHLVVTKPVSRFQILLGKWLGVCILNVLIVALSGGAIYAAAHFLRKQAPLNARDAAKLQDAVWTARVGAQPRVPDLKEAVDAWIAQRIEEGLLKKDNEPELRNARKERTEQLISEWRSVPPGQEPVPGRFYEFENLPPPAREGEVLQVSFKARGIPLPVNEVLNIGWVFVDPLNGLPLHLPIATEERSGDRHQFFVRAGAFEGGRAVLGVINPPDPRQRVAIRFEDQDSLQILYKVGTFESNYLRALLIILLRLAFLAAIGVFFSAFVSFPVAAFCVISIYVMCLGLPWWMESIGANIELYTESVDPYGGWWGQPIRFVLVPILWVVFPDFVALDGTSKLIDGMQIEPGLLGWAAVRLIGFGGVILLLGGWAIFKRREVAEVTV